MTIYLCVVVCMLVGVNSAPVQPDPVESEGKRFWVHQAQQSLRQTLSLLPNTKVAQNAILFLGDGMGVSTITAARIYKGQKDGRSGEETQLHFEKFPYAAFSKTYTVDKQTPDSAATGTAFACGVKANLGTLGVDSRVAKGNCSAMLDPDVMVLSLLDWAYSAGKSVGIVTTTRVTHATPASTYAHTPHRDWETDKDVPSDCEHVKDIAYQLLKNHSFISVILGGGRSKFLNRKDNRNLIQEWLTDRHAEGLRAQYVANVTHFRSLDSGKVDYLLGLFSDSHLEYELQRDNAKEPSLSEMTRKAIEVLDNNKKGFFLFVEGGRIDHAHHENQARRVLEDTVAMDDAVATATSSTGDDTLIVVTADHSHTLTIAGFPSRGNDILGIVDTYYEGYIPTDGKPYTTLVYGNGPGHDRSQNLTAANISKGDFQYQRAVPMPKYGATHSGEDVGIFATGPMAHLFHGVHEQNYIAHAIAYALCVGPNTAHCEQGPLPNGCTGGAAGRRVEKKLGLVVLVAMLLVWSATVGLICEQEVW